MTDADVQEQRRQARAALQVDEEAAGRLVVPRALMRVVRRDPEHLAERLMLYSVIRLGQESWDWAEAQRAADPELEPAVAAARVRQLSARVARIDGAIAGCPFYVAVVPGYLAVLWQQVRMVQRVAALYGRDPRDTGIAAELLALRGVYPTPEAAAEALEALPPELPGKAAEGEGGEPRSRRPVRTWIALVQRVLILAGFMEDPAAGGPRRARWREVLAFAAGGVLWLLTYVIPGLFMVLMSWGCESGTRKLGARAEVFYGDPDVEGRAELRPRSFRIRHDEGHSLREVLRLVLLGLAVAVPLTLMVLGTFAAEKNERILWLTIAGAISGVALIVGLVASARR